jgi:hypothetical protein
MTLSPLELLLLTALVSMVTAVAVRLLFSEKYVRKIECEGSIVEIKRRLDIQFRMLRAIVPCLPIDPATMREILNERGTD